MLQEFFRRNKTIWIRVLQYVGTEACSPKERQTLVQMPKGLFYAFVPSKAAGAARLVVQSW